MLERSFDSVAINRLANGADIRPFVGGDPAQPLDLSAAVNDPRHVFLMGEHGGFACIWTAPFCYEVHTMIRAEGRGRWGFEAGRAGLEYMKAYGAKHLWTRVPDAMANVRHYTAAIGFTYCGNEMVDLGIGAQPYRLYEWRAS